MICSCQNDVDALKFRNRENIYASFSFFSHIFEAQFPVIKYIDFS